MTKPYLLLFATLAFVAACSREETNSATGKIKEGSAEVVEGVKEGANAAAENVKEGTQNAVDATKQAAENAKEKAAGEN